MNAFNISYEVAAPASEEHGLAALRSSDLIVYSVGISTGGSAEIRMAKMEEDRCVVATTLDVKGAAFTKNEVDSQGLSQQIVVKIEDVTQPLPYEDETFDFIYARLILHYLAKDDLNKALAELFRVLKKGGRFYVVVRSKECFEAKSLEAIYDEETCLTSYPYQTGVVKRYFHTPESIQAHLKGAGFSIDYLISYPEQIYVDYQRTIPASHIDDLIELLASK